MRFLDHFLPRRTESADDYSVPSHGGRAEAHFDDAADLLSHLERHPNQSHAIYWTSEAPGDPRCAMVFPTVDGRMIFGLSVAANPVQFLSDLMNFLNSSEGYVDFEAPPPENAAEFADAVRRYNETRNE